MLKRIALLTLLPLSLGSGVALAQSKAKADLADNATAITAGFLNSHPDLQYRSYGMAAYRKQDFEHALQLYRRAGYFADKPSQAMVAEMYSKGEGVPRDMAMAYAWMDLAAERGYVDFIRMRERYWAELDAGERDRAIVEGQALYARFGDAAAKPRYANQLRRGSKEGVGSRTGFVGNVKIDVPGPGGDETIDGSKFRDPQYWDLTRYWKMQDRIWRNPGRVTVGNAETVRDVAPASRIPATQPQIDAPMPEVPERPTP